MIDKLMKELKQNKFTTIVFLIFLALFLLGWLIFGLVMPKNGQPVYGDRLSGIEEVEFKESDRSSLVKELKDKDYVTKASTDVKGKIINVIIETKEKTSVKKSKTLKSIIIKNITKDQLAYYDIQMFVTNENKDAKGYPFIGYKNSTDKNFAF